MADNLTQKKVFAADDPIWIDDVWVDTVVVVGLTCFILCLMGLSKVSLKLPAAALLHPFCIPKRSVSFYRTHHRAYNVFAICRYGI